jgi:hypothetical protein
MTTVLSTAQLDQLIDRVARGKVVPIVGDDLLAIDSPGGPQTLNGLLAERLAAKLDIEPIPMASISDVAAEATRRGTKTQRVRAELSALVKAEAATWRPAEPLRQLASIEGFQLLLTTGIHPLLTNALRAERRSEPVVCAFTPDAREKDLPANWRQSPATIYHLFGAAMNSGTNFAVTEEDTLEGLLSLKEFGPNLSVLVDVLKESHLLLLGCRYPDWLARLFLRIARGKRLGISRDETELVPRDGEPDPTLVRFLERFSSGTEVLRVTSIDLIAQLADAWRTNRPAPSMEEPTTTACAIFISYSNDDAAAARALTEALRRSGLDVWLDKGETDDALKGGEAFDRRIREQIAKCELFVPVLSKRAAARVEGYFRKEWTWAVERLTRISEAVPFLTPVRLDDVPYDHSGVPLEMRGKHWIEMTGGEVNEGVVHEFVKSVRSLRALRSKGVA